MKPPLAALPLAVALWTPACQSVDTHWDYDPHCDFQKLHKYSWMGVRGAPSPFVAKTVRETTDRLLAAKGITLSTEAPDFQVVVWFASEVETTARLSGARTERPGMWGGMPYMVDMQSFRGGSMMLDIVTVASTPEERHLLWRGVAIGQSLSPRMSNEIRAQMLDDTLSGLLSHFPPPGDA